MENVFGTSIIPFDEEERLEKLYSYQVLDTPQEKPFENIVAVAARVFDVPFALISLVDRDRVWLKANKGFGGTKEISRAISLCGRAVLQDEVTVVEDAREVPDLANNPMVRSFGLRLYMAAPLITPDGFILGVVCVLDKKPRKFTKEEQGILKSLADLAMENLEVRRLCA